MFLAISDTVFINSDYIRQVRIEEHFTDEGEKWFVRLYGAFDVPDEERDKDGGILLGPFDTKQAAMRLIFDIEEDITCEVEG